MAVVGVVWLILLRIAWYVVEIARSGDEPEP